MEKDSILTGLVLGAIIPVLGYMVIDQVFEWVTNLGWMDVTSGGGISKRERTLGLLAICCNLIPFQISLKYRYDETMRGVIFPTMIYVGAWLYVNANLLF